MVAIPRRTQTSDNPLEKVIQERIRADLGQEDDLDLWRNHRGAVIAEDEQTGEERFAGVAGLADGGSDLIGILSVQAFPPDAILHVSAAEHIKVTVVKIPIGRFIALEVKRPGCVPSLERREALRARAERSEEIADHDMRDLKQWLFIRRVRAKGGFATYVTSVEDARAAIERARRGECE